MSEITTSNNLGPTPLTAVVKLESQSPKRTMDNMQNSAQSGKYILHSIHFTDASSIQFYFPI